MVGPTIPGTEIQATFFFFVVCLKKDKSASQLPDFCRIIKSEETQSNRFHRIIPPTFEVASTHGVLLVHHFISASANPSQPNLAASIMAHDNPNGALVSLSCGLETTVENCSGEGGEVLRISLSLKMLAITCKNREHNLST
jgi:hypothetical protein